MTLASLTSTPTLPHSRCRDRREYQRWSNSGAANTTWQRAFSRLLAALASQTDPFAGVRGFASTGRTIDGALCRLQSSRRTAMAWLQASSLGGFEPFFIPRARRHGLDTSRIGQNSCKRGSRGRYEPGQSTQSRPSDRNRRASSREPRSRIEPCSLPHGRYRFTTPRSATP